jgi:hypothetical protein
VSCGSTHFLYLKTGKNGEPKQKTLKRINVSKTMKIGELKALISKLFDVDITRIRLWSYESPTSITPLTDLNNTLKKEQIIYGQKILIEKQLKNNVWPRSSNNEKKGATSTFSSTTTNKENSNSNSTALYQKGCCGLLNLGTLSILFGLISLLSLSILPLHFCITDNNNIHTRTRLCCWWCCYVVVNEC